MSSQIAVWYSKIAWSTPCESSGWYGRVRGQELAALQDGVHDRGHVVVVDTGTEKRDVVDRVPRRELLEVPGELGLGQCGRHVELPREAHAGRDVAEELVDRLDADRLEHRLAVLGRQREKAHCEAITSR